MKASRTSGPLAAALVLSAMGCGGTEGPPAPPRTAGEAVLRVFELSSVEDPEIAELCEVLDAELVDEDRTAAFEILATLHDARSPTVLTETGLEGLERTAVDVSAELPGGGSATYSFQSRSLPDGSWRIVSIQAPGAEWPRSTGRGPGLSVSAPAGESGRRR